MAFVKFDGFLFVRPRRESYHDEGRRESTRDRRDSEPSRRRHSDGRGDEPSPKHE